MKRLFKTYLEKPELAGLILLVLLIVLFQVRSHGVFLNQDNLRGILGILPEAGLVAIGVTILMISGEFDLSVGSVFALMPMTMAVLMVQGWPFPLALLAGLLVSAAIGFINGYVTIRFAIPSFITTLGMLFMARSLTVVVSGGFPPLLPADLPTWLFTSFVGPGNMFRMSFLWFVAVAVLTSLMLSRTNFGNWIKATVMGGIIGTTLIRVIDNGLVLSHVDANWFKFAIGFLTIFAVVANAWMRKRAKAIKMEG
ncbi:MAG: ABC transporter permease [Mesorhizobium sp.]|nr:MAG: ABC transporter permease [Mesorhizobium sp.]